MDELTGRQPSVDMDEVQLNGVLNPRPDELVDVLIRTDRGQLLQNKMDKMQNFQLMKISVWVHPLLILESNGVNNF